MFEVNALLQWSTPTWSTQTNSVHLSHRVGIMERLCNVPFVIHCVSAAAAMQSVKVHGHLAFAQLITLDGLFFCRNDVPFHPPLQLVQTGIFHLQEFDLVLHVKVSHHMHSTRYSIVIV